MLPVKQPKQLSKAVLASLLFCALPSAYAAPGSVLIPIAGADVIAMANNHGYVFQSNNNLLVPAGISIGETENIALDNTAGLAAGNVIFEGASAVTGVVGAQGAIHALNFSAPSQTVAFTESDTIINANSLNFASGSDANTQASFANNVQILGRIDNTSDDSNNGIVNFSGNGMVLGTIGATAPLNQLLVNTSGLDDCIITLASSVNVQAMILGVADSGRTIVSFANATANKPMTINGAISSLQNDNDTLKFANNFQGINVNGQIGSASNNFLLLNIQDNVTFAQPAFTQNTLISNNASLTLAPDATLSGAVDGAEANVGSLIFNGDNTLTQAIGSQAALAQVNVNGGTVKVQGSNINAGTLTVGPAGTLALALQPTLQGAVLINDTLALAGNAAVTVNGSLNFVGHSHFNLDLSQATTKLLPNITQNNINNTSGVNIDNTDGVTLGFSALPNNIVSLGTITAPIIYAPAGSIVLTSPSDLTAFTVQDYALIKASAVYSPAADNANNLDEIIVKVQGLPVAAAADQSNTIGIAQALDSIFSTLPVNADFLTLQAALYQEPDAEGINTALAQLAPNVSGSVLQSLATQNNVVFGVIGDQLDSTLLKSTGYAAGDWLDFGGAWAKVFGQHTRQKSRGAIQGYRNNLYGFVVGADRTDEQNTLGLALSWAHAKVKEQLVSDSRVKTDSYQATLYGQYDFSEPFYFNWFAAAGYNKNLEQRRIDILGFTLNPVGRYHGLQYGAKAELGYDFKQGHCHTLPLLSLSYANLHNHHYTEENAGLGFGNLAVDAKHYHTFTGGLGVKFAMDQRFDAMVFQPEAHVMAYYDFNRDTIENTAQFVDIGPSFVTIGNRSNRVSYDLGLSLTTFADSGWVVSASYDLGLQAKFISSTGYLKLRYEWK